MELFVLQLTDALFFYVKWVGECIAEKMRKFRTCWVCICMNFHRRPYTAQNTNNIWTWCREIGINSFWGSTIVFFINSTIKFVTCLFWWISCFFLILSAKFNMIEGRDLISHSAFVLCTMLKVCNKNISHRNRWSEFKFCLGMVIYVRRENSDNINSFSRDDKTFFVCVQHIDRQGHITRDSCVQWTSLTKFSRFKTENSNVNPSTKIFLVFTSKLFLSMNPAKNGEKCSLWSDRG